MRHHWNVSSVHKVSATIQTAHRWTGNPHILADVSHQSYPRD